MGRDADGLVARSRSRATATPRPARRVPQPFVLIGEPGDRRRHLDPRRRRDAHRGGGRARAVRRARRSRARRRSSASTTPSACRTRGGADFLTEHYRRLATLLPIVSRDGTFAPPALPVPVLGLTLRCRGDEAGRGHLVVALPRAGRGRHRRALAVRPRRGARLPRPRRRAADPRLARRGRRHARATPRAVRAGLGAAEGDLRLRGDRGDRVRARRAAAIRDVDGRARSRSAASRSTTAPAESAPVVDDRHHASEPATATGSTSTSRSGRRRRRADRRRLPRPRPRRRLHGAAGRRLLPARRRRVRAPPRPDRRGAGARRRPAAGRCGSPASRARSGRSSSALGDRRSGRRRRGGARSSRPGRLSADGHAASRSRCPPRFPAGAAAVPADGLRLALLPLRQRARRRARRRHGPRQDGPVPRARRPGRVVPAAAGRRRRARPAVPRHRADERRAELDRGGRTDSCPT